MGRWIRTTHRWLSIIFTVAVLINIAALVMGSQATWIGFLALVPLIPMLITGLYLFFHPYLAKGGR
ncbi:MAG: hypothetical protein ACK4RV_10545 [Caulobacter sp.]